MRYIILSIIFLAGCTYDNIVIGYCPTMLPYAELMRTEKTILREFPSSAQVLHSLFLGEIDVALVGRVAKKSEISGNPAEMITRSGYTLVSDEKRLIDYSELEGMEIHTYINEEVAYELLPNSNIRFHDNIEEALTGKIILISWHDWRDEFELIVPMRNGRKVESFRVPVIYTHDEKALSRVPMI
jgi:hypothetical protein